MNGFEFTIVHKNRKKTKVIVPLKRIFLEPEPTDNPLVFWLWDKRLKPAFVVRKKPNNPDIIVMNLHGIENMKDCPEDMVSCPLYLGAVMVEELTHCATRAMRNHKNWINLLGKLQKELYE